MKEAKCQKCGYKWTPRKPLDLIRECPQCKSRNWGKKSLDPVPTSNDAAQVAVADAQLEGCFFASHAAARH